MCVKQEFNLILAAADFFFNRFESQVNEHKDYKMISIYDQTPLFIS